MDKKFLKASSFCRDGKIIQEIEHIIIVVDYPWGGGGAKFDYTLYTKVDDYGNLIKCRDCGSRNVEIESHIDDHRFDGEDWFLCPDCGTMDVMKLHPPPSKGTCTCGEGPWCRCGYCYHCGGTDCGLPLFSDEFKKAFKI